MLRSNNIQQINNKLVYFDKYSTFEQHLEMGLILNDSIVFVGEGATSEDGPFIWTHGKIFGAVGIIEYIHNFINNDDTKAIINGVLAEQLEQLRQYVEANHSEIKDDAKNALEEVTARLASAEEKIKWLQEHGSDEDKIERLTGLLYDEINGIQNVLVEYQKSISAISGIIDEKFRLLDVDGKIEKLYSEVINLAKGYVQEELRKVNLDEHIVEVVGRYMESGLLKDYVTYALLSDEKTITSFAERLLEANEDYAAIKDIASWKNNVTETLSALQQFANKDFASWLLTAEWASSEDGFNEHIASIFGEASKDGSFILMIALRIIASGKFLFRDGNNCISITKEGIRLWVDDGDGIYEPNEQSNFFLGSDGYGYIGKLGKDNDGKDAHPIEWFTDGTVKVQSVTVEGADLNVVSYKSEYRFAKITRSATPSPLSNMLPSNSSNPDAETVVGKDKNNNNINWTKNALSGTRGDAIYMIIRQNKVDSLDNYIKDGAGNYGVWLGPYCISGEDGSLGADSAGINFIYRASNTQIASGETGLTGLTFDPNTETFNRTTDWKNKASDAQISADKKYSYMAFSVDAVFKTDTNGNPTKVIDYWLNYSGPILWSVWGDTGIDGDGVEYIFCVTSDESLTDVSDPYDWYSATGSYLTEEYINSTYAGANGTNPELNKWYDDPQKMAVGQYQWVSKRTYTWKTEIDGLPKKSDGKEWKRYSHPQLWSHYATDGVTSGYMVNVTNPSIIVSVNKDGLLLGNEGEAVGDFTHEIHWNVYKTGGITPTFTTNIAGETPTPLTPYYTVSTSVNTQPVSSSIAAQARQLQSGANEWHYADIMEDNGDPFANLVIVNYSTVKATNDAYDPDTSGTITEDPYYDSTGSSITDYSNLNLILNNVIVNLRFLIYEGGANPYVIDRTVQVCGVYTGQAGQVGSMIDLKVSTKTIYVDRSTGELSPSIVSVQCVESKGDDLTVYYPDDGNSSLFKFGYTKNVLTEPTLENTTRLTTAQIDITNPSLFDQDNYDPITIYLFALKGRVWIPVDFETVGYLLSGESGVGSFVSTVYCRTNETPAAPTGGSYNDAMPNTPKPANVANDVTCTRYLVYKDDGGSMVPVYKTGETALNSNLVKWEDTIPEGAHILWESRCTFRSDVAYSESASTTPEWTKPRQVTDIHDVYDVEFALELDVYDGLSSTEIEDNEPEDSNRHGGSGILVWFDPDLDKDAELPEEKTWKDMVWRAERWRINGEWTDWIITYIKGEKGDSRFTSTIFTRCNVEDGYTVDAPNYDTVNGVHRDNSSTYEHPVPQGSGHNQVTVSNTDENVVEQLVSGLEWHDGIPEGEEQLWGCTGIFEQGAVGTIWKTPRVMTDMETWDVEFSFEDDDAMATTEPVYDVFEGVRNTPFNAYGPNTTTRTYNTDIKWFDTKLDTEGETLPTGKSWKDAIWRAERSKKNGEWGEWTIIKIKGEQGPSGDGYNLTAGGFEGSTLYINYDNLGRKEDGDITVPVQFHFGGTLIPNDQWELDCSSTLDGTEYITYNNDNTITVSGVPADGTHSITITATIESQEYGNDTQTVVIQVARKLNSHYEVKVSPWFITLNTTTHKFGEAGDASTQTVDVQVIRLLDLQAQQIGSGGSKWTITPSYSLGTSTDSATKSTYLLNASNSYPNTIKFTASPNNSNASIEGTLTIQANADGSTPNPPDPNIDYKLVVDGSATYNSATKNLSFNISSWNVLKNEGNNWSEYASNNNTNGVSIEYKASGDSFNTLDIQSYTESTNNTPGSIQFIAKLSGKLISYCYMPVSIIAEGAEIDYDILAGKVGDLGKLFIMQGEFDPTVSYTILNGYTPLVYFHEQGEEHGYWWELIESNTETDTTQNPSKTYKYAPGEHASEYDIQTNRGRVTDYVGRVFNWKGHRSGSISNYTYTNGYWKKVERFSSVVADAIFADFAKFGSAILCGDYIFSLHGKMIGNSAPGTDPYLYFNPQLYSDSSQVVLYNNPDGELLTPYIKNNFYELDANLLRSETDIFVGSKHQSCEIQITAPKLTNDGVIFALGVSSTDRVPIASNNASSNLKDAAFDKYRGKWCKLFYYRNVDDLAQSTLKSIKLVYANTFRPNWCVDLKTGKMIAGCGNFVVEPDGAINVGHGNFTVSSSGNVEMVGALTSGSTITGATILGNYITGGTITGGTFLGIKNDLAVLKYDRSNLQNSYVIIDPNTDYYVHMSDSAPDNPCGILLPKTESAVVNKMITIINPSGYQILLGVNSGENTADATPLISWYFNSISGSANYYQYNDQAHRYTYKKIVLWCYLQGSNAIWTVLETEI